MNSKKLVDITVDALEEIKATDIKVLDVVGLTSIFDYVIIASAGSSRQTKALADNVREKVREAGGVILCFEGEQTGEWLLVDFGDVIVHIMQPEARKYYNLEGLWTE
ncbi:MAG: ribosome silencing factor [Nitrosomonas sp.]|nr:ribosome silencing factor [Nitrosomonas sp.]MCW5607817.1 ribosome silencing factor [Nitrosomonas sp.]